ncbi:MAG: hypothetical protein V1729_02875, partial [Candidatus Woesearchaeota archaeon]
SCTNYTGQSCTAPGGLPGTLSCSAGGGSPNCNNGGGSPYTCTCIGSPSHHITGTESLFSTVNANLWSTQVGTGWIANFTSTNSDNTLGIDNDACVRFDDGTTQCTAASGGGWNTSDGKVYLSNTSAKVGIGTTSPGADLDVTGTVSSILVNSTGSGASDFGTISFSHNGGNLWSVGTGGTGTSANGHLFFYNSQGGGSIPMVIKNGTGNIGIGTSSPNTKLYVYDDIDSNLILTIDNPNSGSSAVSTLALVQNGANARIWNINGGIGFSADADDTGSFMFETQTGSSYHNRLTIENGGNVGIGSSNPGSILDVEDYDAGYGNNITQLTVGVPDGVGSNWTSQIMMEATFENFTVDTGSRNTGLIQAGYDGGPWDTAYLSLGVSGNDCLTDGGTTPCERMRIVSGGNIGIGTSIPDQDLTIEDPGDDVAIHLKKVIQISSVNYGITGANDASVGTRSWDGVSGSGAGSIFFAEPVQTTYYFKSTNYGFSIPSDAVIDGIEFRLSRLGQPYWAGDSYCYGADNSIKIVKGGIIGSTEKSTGTVWSSLGGGSATTTYGGPSDLLGETWTPADINSANFGLVYSANMGGSNEVCEFSVTVDSMTVYYTGTGWTAGMDHSDSNSFKISLSGDVSENPALVIDTSKDVFLNHDLDVGNNLDVENNVHISGDLDVAGGDITTAILRFGTGTSSGQYEFEDGGVCVGSGGCTAPTTDGDLLVEGDVTISGGDLFATSLRFGSASSSGLYEFEDGGVCIGDGGCTAPTTDGNLLVAGDVLTTDILKTGGTNFFTGGCTDKQYITGISSAGAISCSDDSASSSVNCGTTNAVIKRTGTDTYGCSGVIDASDATAITISSAEYVGIGTTTPGEPLDIEYTCSSCNVGVASLGNSGTYADGDYSLAVGYDSYTSIAGDYGFALGYGSRSTYWGAIAMGEYAISQGSVSVAIGERVFAGGMQAVAIGNYAKASGRASTALGNHAKADVDYSGAWGGDACDATATNCDVDYSGVFGIFGALCVSTAAGICPDVPDGNIRYDTGIAAFDLAEGFPTDKQLDKGDVVVIVDNVTIGHTNIPYDTRAAGVISTSPNIAFNFDEADGDFSSLGGIENYTMPLDRAPLSLAGRVPVKVTDENGPIMLGDSLTTSSKPGYAMKWSLVDLDAASDINELKQMMKENDRRRNAIIGKALEEHSSGDGLIMMLTASR